MQNKKGIIFLISDLHLDHKNIIGYEKRPFKTKEEMNKELVRRWNRTVKKSDTVYFLGDLSLGKTDDWLRKLNGRIIFIKGNHDHSKKTKFKDKIELKYKGHKLFLTHWPQDKPDDWDGWMIHGHGHSKRHFFNPKSKSINVCVEVTDYAPVSIDLIIDFIRKKKRPIRRIRSRNLKSLYQIRKPKRFHERKRPEDLNDKIAGFFNILPKFAPILLFFFAIIFLNALGILFYNFRDFLLIATLAFSYIGGTMLHEFGHKVFCDITGVRVIKTEFFSWSGVSPWGELVDGFVIHERPKNLTQSFFITIGPMITTGAVLFLVVLIYIFNPSYFYSVDFVWYIVFGLFLAMFPSTPDVDCLQNEVRYKKSRKKIIFKLFLSPLIHGLKLFSYFEVQFISLLSLVLLYKEIVY